MSIKNRAVAVACGLALAATALAPAAAFAAGNATTVTNGNTGTTDVTVQVQKDQGVNQLAFEVPTVIPFAAKANGELVGPSASETRIVNLSVFPIHVTGMSTSAKGTGWSLVADASKSASENSLSFELSADPAADPAADSFAGAVSASDPRDLSKDANWNMGYAGSGKDSVAIASTGKVSHVTKDLSSAQKAATVTWTLAAGAAE